MAVDGVVNYPSFFKVKTIGGTERYLNSSMIVEIAPSKEKDLERASDIIMINGQVHTVKESPSLLIENCYVREIKNGSSVINFVG